MVALVPPRKPPGRAQAVVRGGAPSPARRWFTAKEMADLLRVSLSTIYSKIRSGELNAFRFGREFRISKRDLRG